MTRRVRTWLAVGAGIAVLTFIATVTPAYQTVAYVSETTGSTYGYHLWPGGFKTAQSSHVSAFEKYVAAHLHEPVRQRWTRCANMGTTIFEDNISFADEPGGGMVYLKAANLERWMNHHTEKEILGLYQFLLTADYVQSRKRADEVLEEVDGYH
jgi:hypothetical protein